MEHSGRWMGEAVFLRTDVPDYAEERVPFGSINELVEICCRSFANLSLDKVVVFGQIDQQPCSVTFGFLASMIGRLPTDSQIRNSR